MTSGAAGRITPVDRAVRLAYVAAYPIARMWWGLRRPSHRGALVAIWVAGRLLLLRQSYQPLAAFPGGGVRPGEAPDLALRRELREELGLRLGPEALIETCTTTQLWDGRRDTVTFFECVLSAQPALRLDRREIDAAWFADPDDLAGPVSPPVAYYLGWRAGGSQATRRFDGHAPVGCAPPDPML